MKYLSRAIALSVGLTTGLLIGLIRGLSYLLVFLAIAVFFLGISGVIAQGLYLLGLRHNNVVWWLCLFCVSLLLYGRKSYIWATEHSRKVLAQFEGWLEGKTAKLSFDEQFDSTLKQFRKEHEFILTALCIGGLLIAGSFGMAVGKTFFENIRHSYYDVSSKRNLQKIVSDIQGTLPRKVSDDIRLVSARAEEALIEYDYEIDRMPSNITEQEEAEKIKSFMPSVIRLACSTPQTRDGLLNQGITMRYLYYDPSSKYLGGFDIKRTNCSGISAQHQSPSP